MAADNYNMPESLFDDPTWGGAFGTLRPIEWSSATVEQLIHLLHDPNCRERALLYLSKKQEEHERLGPILWNSFRTVSILLEEVSSILKLLTPEKLTHKDSTRVCNAITLLQCLASHPDTKQAFLTVRVPDYLFPFVETGETTRPFQFLRLGSLGAFAALLKHDGHPIVPQAVSYFLESQLILKCIFCIEIGDVTTQTVATFILSKMMMQVESLPYYGVSAKTFFTMIHVFARLLENLGDNPSPQILKHVIRCCLIMSAAPRPCDALKIHLPTKLWSPAVMYALRNDAASIQKLHQLHNTVVAGHWAIQEPVGNVLNVAIRRQQDHASTSRDPH